jgi:hypothetical protein
MLRRNRELKKEKLFKETLHAMGECRGPTLGDRLSSSKAPLEKSMV